MVNEIQKMAKQESEYQKEVVRLEEENLHLRLQIEQLQLETPRLRDRVQHLQKYASVSKTTFLHQTCFIQCVSCLELLTH